ncbi:hypothetical protein JOQ06_025467 [Pogonophryne albipinna]|uniref:Uncharacterized protein n=1 Tax=Pogonophryne albipinna TaxID=1090488 RepID=A0AAD6AUD9_9TELE|nr:hypothetical protein JOQ06_025467 [Pogonophryne albipinna]
MTADSHSLMGLVPYVQRADCTFLCGAATCQASQGVRPPRDEAQQSHGVLKRRTSLKACSIREQPLNWGVG